MSQESRPFVFFATMRPDHPCDRPGRSAIDADAATVAELRHFLEVDCPQEERPADIDAALAEDAADYLADRVLLRIEAPNETDAFLAWSRSALVPMPEGLAAWRSVFPATASPDPVALAVDDAVKLRLEREAERDARIAEERRANVVQLNPIPPEKPAAPEPPPMVARLHPAYADCPGATALFAIATDILLLRRGGLPPTVEVAVRHLSHEVGAFVEAYRAGELAGLQDAGVPQGAA